MRTLRVPLLALAALALFTSAAADGLVIVPFTNGKFELGDKPWTLGAAAVIDADYSGDKELYLAGDSSAPRLAGGFEAGPAPATLPVTFAVERPGFTLTGVTLRTELMDLRDAGAPAGGLVWSFESLGQGRYYLYPAAAAFPENPAWSGMTPEEREAELASYLYVGVSLTVLSAPIPVWVDDLGVVLGA